MNIEHQSKMLKAIKVTSTTLIGISGKPPLTRGNCFSVLAEDGNEYRIVNFVYENLQCLLSANLTWPISIKVIGGKVAVIHDYRIPHEWYSIIFCEVCCPESMLPLPQVLKNEREVMQGIREYHENYMIIRLPKIIPTDLLEI